ncbi:maleate cis-trans isomerase family protein [Mobilicoccus massiliensis]|uniref:maleate cis-trans isomerase family protein n=1 Tax=Mobilicoccus massiliensis TaxID=1522310 RepID=UPI00059142D9|nr:hypothetical protein [Mobilicoccus massiliensis]
MQVPPTPILDATVGVIAPYDFALDRELWRWAPHDVSLAITRSPTSPFPVSREQATDLAEAGIVRALAAEVRMTQAPVCAYLCTSGSFVHGAAGERRLVEAMRDAGFPHAVTTSGSLLAAIDALDVARVAIATPYDDEITGLLVAYLADAGVEVTAARHLGLAGHIWTVDYTTTARLAIAAAKAGSGTEALFLSCTNLASYDLIAPLETELGIPVLTASHVTMWAALRAVGRRPEGAGRLLEL